MVLFVKLEPLFISSTDKIFGFNFCHFFQFSDFRIFGFLGSEISCTGKIFSDPFLVLFVKSGATFSLFILRVIFVLVKLFGVHFLYYSWSLELLFDSQKGRYQNFRKIKFHTNSLFGFCHLRDTRRRRFFPSKVKKTDIGNN